MKKSLFIMLLMALMIACKGVTPKVLDGDDMENDTTQVSVNDSEQEVIDVITARLVEAYNVEVTDKSKYLSSTLSTLISKADEVTPEGMVGTIDYDIWYMAQDTDSPKMEIKDIKLTSDTNAEVKLQVSDFGSTQTQTLSLVKENGVWLVDDFNSNGCSLKTIVKEFIESQKD